MDFDKFIRERFQMPVFGKAPIKLIIKYLAVVHQMEQLYGREESLSSDAMLELNEKANSLVNQISSYSKLPKHRPE